MPTREAENVADDLTRISGIPVASDDPVIALAMDNRQCVEAFATAAADGPAQMVDQYRRIAQHLELFTKQLQQREKKQNRFNKILITINAVTAIALVVAVAYILKTAT